MAVLGALLLVNIVGDLKFHFEALEFKLKMEVFQPGMTQVEIPPIGLIRAHTHFTPLKIIVRLENIDMDLIKKFLGTSPNQEQLIAEARYHIKKVIKEFAMKIVFLGAVGGAFGVYLIRCEKSKALFSRD